MNRDHPSRDGHGAIHDDVNDVNDATTGHPTPHVATGAPDAPGSTTPLPDDPPDGAGTLDLTTLRQQLDEANAIIADLERAKRIDELLRASNTIDLEAARLLTEIAVSEMEDADVEQAVRDLRTHRPYLFRGKAIHHRAMSHRIDVASHAQDEVDNAAEVATTTGHRRDLLRYLRLRRR